MKSHSPYKSGFFVFGNMNQIVLVVMVALGGALGAVIRYFISSYLYSDSFPYATLLVNVLGSFIFGFLFLVLHQSIQVELWKHFVLVGFLGSLTTFSTFSYQTVDLFQSDRWIAGIINISLSLLLCLLSTSVGIWLSKKWIYS